MKDVYILRLGSRIVCVADDFDRCSMEMARYAPDQQKDMRVENYDLLEEGD